MTPSTPAREDGCTSVGFDVKEPLALVSGKPRGGRAQPMEDLDACERLCREVHGFERTAELRGSIQALAPSAGVRDGSVVAYPSNAQDGNARSNALCAGYSRTVLGPANERPTVDTLVFIPAWNEAESLPGVLDEARRDLPGVDLLVIDDGSTDATAQVARAGGARVVSFGENRGLPVGIAAGYRQALEGGYEYCGRLDADGQHPAVELAGMLELVRSGKCDVAVGSRFLPESGQDEGRYRPSAERVVGTSLLRLLIRLRLGEPISDATSGLYAVDRAALALLADPYVSESPEVEALMRIADANLRLLEVPVHMRPREHGESSFTGRRAAALVVSIGLTLFAGEFLRRRRRRQKKRPRLRLPKFG